MEYIEVILKNIKNVQIQDVFCDFLLFDEKDIISSHFFNQKKNKDVSYQEIGDLKKYFCTPGNCNIYLKKAMIGIELKNVLIHIACDERYGDITINFEEEQIREHSEEEIIKELQNLLISFIRIYKSAEVGEIILGYEPADDADMKIIEISQNKVEIFNEKYFESPFEKIIYSIAKDMNI